MKSWYDLPRKERKQLSREFSSKGRSIIIESIIIFLGFVLNLYVVFVYAGNSDYEFLTLNLFCGIMCVFAYYTLSAKYDRDFSKWLETSKKVIK